MDHNFLGYLALILVAVLLYAVASRALFQATQVIRYSLLDIGEKLLADPSFPDAERREILERLDDAHSPAQAWRIVASSIIVGGLILFGRPDPKAIERDVPAHLRGEFQKFIAFWLIATVTNSLAATVLFGLFTMGLIAFVISAGALSELLAARQSSRDGRRRGLFAHTN